jgi:hypothetical protein
MSKPASRGVPSCDTKPWHHLCQDRHTRFCITFRGWKAAARNRFQAGGVFAFAPNFPNVQFLLIFDRVEVLEVSQTAYPDYCTWRTVPSMGKELLVRVVAISAGVFTVAAVALIVFSH